MTVIVFTISILAGLLIITLAISTLFADNVQFWPPPGRHTWQYLVFWLLFRIMTIGVIVLSIIDFHGNGGIGSIQTAIGVLLAFFGFGAGLYATMFLGWRNAHGEPEALKTTGWYRWSRNPIYVVSLVGIIGLGLFVNSMYLNFVLILWASIYILAPFIEEPWLIEKYGEDYLNYQAKVPRFIGKFSTRNHED